MNGHPEIRPNVIPWPPLIYGAAALTALALHAALPLYVPLGVTGRALGWCLAVLGGSLDLSAMLVMARARTTILPHHAASQLVTSGPFGWTRNPIYLGNTLLLTGLGLAQQYGLRWQ